MYTIIFDLDGTVSDPKEGITKSINHTLVELGYQAKAPEMLEKYIGPPLDVIFTELLETGDGNIIARAIDLFRGRYGSIGYRENFLYDGMKDILAQLHGEGFTLCVATSKRQDIAEIVVDYFELNDYFSYVRGCNPHCSKVDMLGGIKNIELQMVMALSWLATGLLILRRRRRQICRLLAWDGVMVM
ncbi:MAG: HAD hydrolase-like protein [Sedimentisphaerales bacterium]|nr:HAD hydrolase-like protein [Sedimentisphaerales bacterium]